MEPKYFHLRVRRWVVWWIVSGVVCGAIAVVNMIGHHLSRPEDRVLILLGIAHWLLGGIVCWAFDGVMVKPDQQSGTSDHRRINAASPQAEYHPASDFLLPGGRRSVLPWKH